MRVQTIEFLAGLRAEAPILVGTVPFGVTYGVLARQAGLSASAAQAMSTIVFAGSSQFVTAQLVYVGTPALILIGTAAIINLRHGLYSASLAPYLERLPLRWKLLLAYLLTDEAYAVTITRFQDDRDEQHRHWFMLGAGLALWVNWQCSTAVGVFLGGGIAAAWSLDFTLALTFIALLVPTLRHRASAWAAVTAAVVALAAAPLPFRLNLLLAALAGVAAGVWRDKQQ
ncbi:MAG: AzlC family ABC transporter permease [Herpetosiphon sp.]